MSGETRQQWVAMGHIKGALGVKGWVKVSVSTEYTDSLLDYPQWRLTKEGHSQTLAVAAGKVSGDELQVQFDGIHDRDAAALLRGYVVEVNRADFAEPEENQYYWADLVGLTVYNQDKTCLGSVSTLMETGAHDILVVDGSYGRKLIPFVAAYIHHVNLPEKQIEVDWGTDY